MIRLTRAEHPDMGVHVNVDKSRRLSITGSRRPISTSPLHAAPAALASMFQSGISGTHVQEIQSMSCNATQPPGRVSRTISANSLDIPRTRTTSWRDGQMTRTIRFKFGIKRLLSSEGISGLADWLRTLRCELRRKRWPPEFQVIADRFESSRRHDGQTR